MGINKATEIKVSLLRLGVSQSKIAGELGVTVQSVHQVIHGIRKSQRISEYIEKLTKKAA
jgi:predicted transcriptional regulator